MHDTEAIRRLRKAARRARTRGNAPDCHKYRIAADTLKLSDVGAFITSGGLAKDEARHLARGLAEGGRR